MTDRSPRALRDDAAQHSPLPVGTRVRDYVVERVLGNGGFGITYLAHHVTLDRRIAMKEFFPREFAVRTGLTIRPSGADDQVYDWSRRKFLEEARVIARFNHPSIVRVLDVFEANGTAYMVQGFEAGQSLGAWLKARRGAVSQRALDELLGPLLGALEEVHEKGLLHRDIAPDNVIIRRDGRPVLIDFGAARGYLGEQTRTVAVVKPGFSPPEQYTPDARHQGPWTDIYALAATLYLAVTGEVPQVAPQRTLDDDNVMPRAADAAGERYRRGFLEAIDLAMSMRPADRPQSVAEWRGMLLGDAPARPAGQRAPPLRPQPPRPTGGRSTAGPAPTRAMPHWPRIAVAVIGVIMMIAAITWIARGAGAVRVGGSGVPDRVAGTAPASGDGPRCG